VVDVPAENGKDLVFDSAGTTLSWTASTVPNVTYNVYRGSWSAGAFSFAPTCFAPGLTQSQVSATQSRPVPPRGSSTWSPARTPAGKEPWDRASSATSDPTTFPAREGISTPEVTSSPSGADSRGTRAPGAAPLNWTTGGWGSEIGSLWKLEELPDSSL
jgi:hypothetical protein